MVGSVTGGKVVKLWSFTAHWERWFVELCWAPDPGWMWLASAGWWMSAVGGPGSCDLRWEWHTEWGLQTAPGRGIDES